MGTPMADTPRVRRIRTKPETAAAVHQVNAELAALIQARQSMLAAIEREINAKRAEYDAVCRPILAELGIEHGQITGTRGVGKKTSFIIEIGDEATEDAPGANAKP
jgi:hypothetical protein